MQTCKYTHVLNTGSLSSLLFLVFVCVIFFFLIFGIHLKVIHMLAYLISFKNQLLHETDKSKPLLYEPVSVNLICYIIYTLAGIDGHLKILWWNIVQKILSCSGDCRWKQRKRRKYRRNGVVMGMERGYISCVFSFFASFVCSITLCT